MDSTVEAALIGAAAALIGVGGTVIVAIAGARNSRQTNQATIDAAHADALLTLDITREAQFADRYSRALEQIGSDNLDVRIGGIYALEGIALDSPRHHPTVMEVLTAFIREHSRIPPGDTRPKRWPLPDVEAALTVVGRRKTEHDVRSMNLTGMDLMAGHLIGANLKGANLTGARLSKANLNDANLSGALLGRADLTGASFLSADLTSAILNESYLLGAHFTRANLTRAKLWSTNLAEAHLVAANLTDADLTGSDLSRASLRNGHLAEANLADANLSSANLTDANLTDACLINANFTDANLTGADFTGTDLTSALWPDGVEAPEGWTRETGRQVGEPSRLRRAEPGQ